ncbi:MAG TPA: hypothetical protein PL033_20015 [Candidatus Brocadiia bacterium]|nr:hypothetical protein [Candidatus Brocadiia bacterium]
MPVRFRCKDCGKQIEAPSSHFGRNVFCTDCGRPNLAPQPVRHSCDKCGRSGILNGAHDGRKCACGGVLTATKTYVKSARKDVTKVFDLTDLDDGPDDF